jgi:hypothetical protein
MKSHRYRAAEASTTPGGPWGDADRRFEILADLRHADVERHEIESPAARRAARRQQQAAAAEVVRGEASRLSDYRVCPPPRPFGVEAPARVREAAPSTNFEPRGRCRRMPVTQNAPTRRSGTATSASSSLLMGCAPFLGPDGGGGACLPAAGPRARSR